LCYFTSAIIPGTAATATTQATGGETGSPTKTSKGGACGAKAVETGFMAALVVGAMGAIF